MTSSRLEELAHSMSQKNIAVAARSFIFLRHGETDANHAKIYQKRDQLLNENGIAQAHRAASMLVDRSLKRIFSSDMPRAWQTAQIVQDLLSLPTAKCEHFRERWFGDLAGTSSVDLDWSVDPPNGERLVDFVDRTINGLKEFLLLGDFSLLVAHGGTLLVIAAALGVRLESAQKANAVPLQFARDASGWHLTPLASVNNTETPTSIS